MVWGFYLDPNPYGSSEFRGPIINAFIGMATPGGPADGKAALFTVVVAEMAHALGINNSIVGPRWY
jgi:hypothetical protein